MPRILPYHTEHNMMEVPTVVRLDPRCKEGLVHVQYLGDGSIAGHLCTKCGNGEEGIPYIKAALLTGRVSSIIFRSKADRAAVLQIIQDLAAL